MRVASLPLREGGPRSGFPETSIAQFWGFSQAVDECYSIVVFYKFYNRGVIGEAMRVVTYASFHYYLDYAAVFLIILFEVCAVFRIGNDLVTVACRKKNRNIIFKKLGDSVYRVIAVVKKLG